MSLGVVFCPPWLLSCLSPASWPPLPRERLKPHAIDIRANIDPVHWFLRSQSDTRSSLYLEDAATEFHVQGLELDWTKSHLGCRLTLEWERLELSQFWRGPKDEISRIDMKKPERRQYLKNASVSADIVPTSPVACYPTATRASRVGMGVRRRHTMLSGRLPSWET